MLSDDEKRDMKAAAKSDTLRRECDDVRALSQLPVGQPANLDQLVQFLTFMSRLSPTAKPEPPIPFPNARL